MRLFHKRAAAARDRQPDGHSAPGGTSARIRNSALNLTRSGTPPQFSRSQSFSSMNSGHSAGARPIPLMGKLRSLSFGSNEVTDSSGDNRQLSQSEEEDIFQNFTKRMYITLVILIAVVIMFVFYSFLYGNNALP